MSEMNPKVCPKCKRSFVCKNPRQTHCLNPCRALENRTPAEAWLARKPAKRSVYQDLYSANWN